MRLRLPVTSILILSVLALPAGADFGPGVKVSKGTANNQYMKWGSSTSTWGPDTTFTNTGSQITWNSATHNGNFLIHGPYGSNGGQNGLGITFQTDGPGGAWTIRKYGLGGVFRDDLIFSNDYDSTTAGTFGGQGNTFTVNGGTYPAQFTVFTKSPGVIGSIIREASSQSADIQQWQNSTTTALAKIDKDGVLTTSGYKSSDGTAGITQDIVITSGSSTTLHVKNGLIVGVN